MINVWDKRKDLMNCRLCNTFIFYAQNSKIIPNCYIFLNIIHIEHEGSFIYALEEGLSLKVCLEWIFKENYNYFKANALFISAKVQLRSFCYAR